MAYQDEPRIEIRIPPDRVDELLSRLTEDDEFRERVEGDPSATLAEYDVYVPPLLYEDEISLPSPKELMVLREQLDAGELDPAALFGNFGRKFGLFLWIIIKFRKFRR